MFKKIDKDMLAHHEEEKTSPSSNLKLFHLGRRKGFVTLEENQRYFPQAEGAAAGLREESSALMSAGKQHIEDNSSCDSGKEGESSIRRGISRSENHYDHIDNDDLVRHYFKDVSQIPLLTIKQEVELAQRIEQGRIARVKLAQGGVNHHRVSELLRLIEDGDIARRHLITANSRLVISVAKKYTNRGVPFVDLIQEGNIGLMRAVKKYDQRRGYKFSTYATWWIRQAVTRAIADQGRTIRVPVHMGDRISKMLRVKHLMTQSLNREPTTEELAATLNVAPKNVEYMIKISQRPLSLERPILEGDVELGDFIQDQESPDPVENVTYNLLSNHLREVLGQLPPREARILQLRYGFLDGKTKTLQEVGQKMGVTRERVRQIEAQALHKLRNLANRRKLRAFFE